MTQKYTIKFVNKGKPFEMPIWNNKKHEAVLAKLAKDQEKYEWNDKQAGEEFKYYVIHETLLEIDENCTLEEVKKFCIHPMTTTELFHAVYDAGRENIYYIEPSFRKGKTQSDKKSKSTGTKS